MDATINIKGIDFDVEFNYQPEEPQTRDYPGSAESIEIESVFFGGTDFTSFFYEMDANEMIEELIAEHLKD